MRAAADGQQRLADALEKAALGTRRGKQRGRRQPGMQIGEFGQQEAPDLCQGVLRNLLQPSCEIPRPIDAESPSTKGP